MRDKEIVIIMGRVARNSNYPILRVQPEIFDRNAMVRVGSFFFLSRTPMSKAEINLYRSADGNFFIDYDGGGTKGIPDNMEVPLHMRECHYYDIDPSTFSIGPKIAEELRMAIVLEAL